jgi:hypothetical protein
VGALNFYFGRRWNRENDVHRFCTLRLQTWGIIYCAFGCLLLPYAWMGMRLEAGR